jgi:hypothetical protein
MSGGRVTGRRRVRLTVVLNPPEGTTGTGIGMRCRHRDTMGRVTTTVITGGVIVGTAVAMSTRVVETGAEVVG